MTDKLVEALKPCPFCGAEAQQKQWTDGAAVGCSDPVRCLAPHAIGLTVAAAAKRWNQRAALSATPEPGARVGEPWKLGGLDKFEEEGEWEWVIETADSALVATVPTGKYTHHEAHSAPQPRATAERIVALSRAAGALATPAEAVRQFADMLATEWLLENGWWPKEGADYRDYVRDAADRYLAERGGHPT